MFSYFPFNTLPFFRLFWIHGLSHFLSPWMTYFKVSCKVLLFSSQFLFVWKGLCFLFFLNHRKICIIKLLWSTFTLIHSYYRLSLELMNLLKILLYFERSVFCIQNSTWYFYFPFLFKTLNILLHNLCLNDSCKEM